jgi:hypothetical protein
MCCSRMIILRSASACRLWVLEAAWVFRQRASTGSAHGCRYHFEPLCMLRVDDWFMASPVCSAAALLHATGSSSTALLLLGPNI